MKFIFNNKEYPSIDGVKKAYYGGQGPVPPGPDYTEPFWVKNEYTKYTRLRVEYANNILASLDQVTWRDPTSSYVRVNAGEKVYIKCAMRSSTRIWLADSMSTGTSRDMSVGGNYMSLFYGDDFTGYETTFPYEATPNRDGYLFSNCLSAKEMILPATTLFVGCYSNMFKDNSRLVDAPELPVTTLVNGCYESMFQGCTSLTTAPELPARTLDNTCYQNMFYGCTSLNSIKCLATDISATNCLSNWMYNVPSGGTFTKAAGVTWPSGTSGIPNGWTVVEE